MFRVWKCSTSSAMRNGITLIISYCLELLPTTDGTKTLSCVYRVRVLYIVYILSPVRVKKLDFGFDLRKDSFNDCYTYILVP